MHQSRVRHPACRRGWISAPRSGPRCAAAADHGPAGPGPEPAGLIAAGRELAGQLLAGLPGRLHHTRHVAQRAAELSSAVADTSQQLLIAAAWLHDIGYSPSLGTTGFHPLDGANYLLAHGFPTALAELVAHHSGARFIAHAHGLSGPLARYRYQDTDVSDALTYADQTVGPDGRRLSLPERITDMLHRHGPDSPNAKVHRHRGPYLHTAATRVQHRLAQQ